MSGSSTRKTAHDPGAGAAIGAAVGGATGGGVEAYKSNKAFEQAYERCLRERGHAVPN